MAVPERVVTNVELEQLVETSDDWIRERTGIIERRVAGPNEYTSVLATASGRMALARANITPDQVDLLILATCTPDCLLPATACVVQAQLGLPNVGAFDLSSVCSGFVYGLAVATSMIRSGAHQTVLLIAADTFTRHINWSDRTTCILFGDGAGAVVLQATEKPTGLLSSVLGSDGSLEWLMMAEAGGSRLPLTCELLRENRHRFVMHGREVFKHAVRGMAESVEKIIKQAGLTMNDIRLVIPHQANLRIIEALAKRLNIPLDRVVINIERYGNTSAASIPIALHEAAEEGRLQPGDLILMTAFGSGLAWASAIVRWGS